MTVVTPTQPDFTAQSGSVYKTAIDGAATSAGRIGWAFAPFATPDSYSPAGPDMHVQVHAGHVATGGATTEVAAQEVGPFAAPGSNPRHDLVVVDRTTGAASVITGAEAASPSDPAVTAGNVPVARVRLFVGMAEITNTDIDDIRPLFVPAGTAATRNVGEVGGVQAYDADTLKADGFQNLTVGFTCDIDPVSYAASITPSLSTPPIKTLTATGNFALNKPAGSDGGNYVLRVTNSGTVTMTPGTGVTVVSGEYDTTNTAVNILYCTYWGDNTMDVTIAQR